MALSITFQQDYLGLASATALTSSIVRIVFSRYPLSASPTGTNDARNPNNYAIDTAITNGVDRVQVVSSNPSAFDLYLTNPLAAGTHTITVANVQTVGGIVLTTPLIQSFTVVAAVAQGAVSGGAISGDPEETIHRHFHPALRSRSNPNWGALVSAFAVGDQINQTNAQLAYDQKFLTAARENYLTLKAGSSGIERPKNVGLSDDLFRELAITSLNRKVTQESLLSALEVFYTPNATRGYVETLQYEPFVLADGEGLEILLDETTAIEMAFDSTNFQTIGAASAIEVATTITAVLRKYKSTAYAIPCYDSVLGVWSVRIYSASKGLGSSVRITGGTAQTALQFDTKLNLYQLGGPWVEQLNSTPNFRTAISSSANGAALAAGGYPGYVYTSADSGATWVQQLASGNRYWFGLACSVDGVKLAGTVDGGYIYTSTDSGVGWTQRTASGMRNWRGIASSTDGVNLAAVVAGGYIYTSADSGATWTQQTASGTRGWRWIASSSDGAKLAAVVAGGYIYTSADSGATWTQRTSVGIKSWTWIASSSDGVNLSAVANGDYVYTSADSGATWVQQTASGIKSWNAIASSTDGVNLITTANNDYVYTSADSGTTWTQQVNSAYYGLSSVSYDGIASSSDGVKLVGCSTEGYGFIYTSADTGVSWSARYAAGPYFYEALAGSSDLVKLVGGNLNGYVYTSTDSGATWVQRTASPLTNGFSRAASSSTGVKLVVAEVGFLYTSTDSGISWTQRVGAGSRYWTGLASSSDGVKLVAGAYYDGILTSTDSGATWTLQAGAGIHNWQGVASSSDGVRLAAIGGQDVYTSADSGVTWIQQPNVGTSSLKSIATSSDGSKLAVTEASGYIHTSSDYGVTWTQQNGSGSRTWGTISSSSSGTRLIATDTSGFVYISSDSGATWTPQLSPGPLYGEAALISADGDKFAVTTPWWMGPGHVHTNNSTLPIWTITYDSVNKTVRLACSGDSGLTLLGLQMGDYINIAGTEFNVLNRGSFAITNVNVTYPGGVKTQYLEFINENGVAEGPITQVADGSVVYFRPQKETSQRIPNSSLSVVARDGVTSVSFPATTRAVARDEYHAAYANLNPSQAILYFSRNASGLVELVGRHGITTATAELLIEPTDPIFSVPSMTGYSDQGAYWDAGASEKTIFGSVQPQDDRCGHQGCLLSTGDILLVGGKSMAGGVATYLDSCDLFSVISKTKSSTDSWYYTYNWLVAGSLNAPRCWFSCSSIDAGSKDGMILVTGGITTGGAWTDTCELYLPAVGGPGIWTNTTVLPAVRAGHKAVFSSLWISGDGVMVTGGCSNDTTSLATCELFSPIDETWAAAHSMSAARTDHSLVVLSDGTFLVTGGRTLGVGTLYEYTSTANMGTPLASCERYSPAMNNWSWRANMLCPRFGHASILLPDGRVLVAGGWGLTHNATIPTLITETEIWDSNTRQWGFAGRLRQGKEFAQMMLDTVNNRVYVMDGNPNQAEYLDLNTMKWEPSTAVINDSRRFAVATQVDAYATLFSGGYNGSNTTGNHLLLLPANEKFTQAGMSEVATVTVVDSTTLTYQSSRKGLVITNTALNYTPIGAQTQAVAGPYVFDPKSGVAVTAQKTTLTQELGADKQYNRIFVASTTDLPDEAGYLCFGFGQEYQTINVPYLGKLSATLIMIDPHFTFPIDIPNGAEVSYLYQRGPWVPEEEYGSFYITAAPAGRVAAEKVVDFLHASGTPLEKTIKYPGDAGLGNEGRPTSGTNKLSDKVRVWAGDDVDEEVEELEQE